MEEPNRNKILLEEQFRSIKWQIQAIDEKDELKALCDSFLADAIDNIATIKNIAHPEIHPRIDTLTLSFLNLSNCLSAHLAKKIQDAKESCQQDARTKKETHDLIVGVAQATAQKEWGNDTEYKIRIREMVEVVWSAMIDDGFVNFLPESRETIRDWIAPVAPDYARAPGRPKKAK
ncbi:hypothetical protein SAMN05216271_3588 [Halopseudomonas sabulinigri]|uniref:Uncharacterized protein n=1 Tax=Halopseudomonas sabulinigri TaxID=472181 RepID=A0A1H1XLC8_9GAMM|nr:hypothetical protein [Halopseudomonas sabulinigri]SDT10067.1 hypothetical protein SAMN05216271_3588 [Halopseudomonas sabulinigri]